MKNEKTKLISHSSEVEPELMENYGTLRKVTTWVGSADFLFMQTKDFGKKLSNTGYDQWRNLRSFLAKTVVIDLTIAVIIGQAFSAVFLSLINDVFIPPIAAVLGNRLVNWFYVLQNGKSNLEEYNTLEEAKTDGAVTINLGKFVQAIVYFIAIIICLYIVMLIFRKIVIQKLIGEEVAHAKPVKECPFCFMRIDERAIKCPNCCSVLDKSPS